MRTMLMLTAVGALAGVASATTWTDRTAFNNANPGLDLIDFEGIAPAGGFIKPVDDLWTGVQFRDGNNSREDTAIADSGFFFGTPTDAFFIDRFDGNFNANFTRRTEAVGFNVAIGFGGFAATVEVYNGNTLLAREQFDTAPEQQLTTFIGFSNLGPITNLRVIPQAGGFVLADNFAHGIPAPGAGALLALAGLAAARRRRA